MNALRHLLLFFLLGLSLAGMRAEAAVEVYPGTAYTLSGNGSLSPVTPTAYNGDVLIAQVVTKASVTPSAPSGWTLLSKASTTQGSGNTGVRQYIYYLNLTAIPSSSYTWTITGGGSYSAEAVIYAIHNSATITCATSSSSNCAASYQAGSGLSMIAPNVGTSFSAGAVRLAFFASGNGSSTITPALENSATAGTYSQAGSGTSGVGMHGTYYLLTSSSSGDQQTATQSVTTGQIASSLIIAAGSVSLTCYSDTFNRTTGLGSDWAVTSVGTTSYTPNINTSTYRLRMTDASVNESTAASLQKLFPGSGNYLSMTFKYYGYNGSGADGIALILSDGSVTPVPGGFGGSLGYAPKSSSGTAGFAGGWLGLGLDEYGNFSNKSDSGACAPSVTSCATSAVSQSVSVRGSSSTYYWLKGTGTLSTKVSNSTGHMYRVTVDSLTSGTAYLTVERDTTGTGASYSTLLSRFNVLGTNMGQSALPTNFILSLTGSTGDSTNIHEIDDLTVCAQSMNEMTSINHYRFAINTALTCTPAAVTVTACLDADCTSTYSGDVTATLTATTTNSNDGWVAGSSQTFAGSGATLYLRETTAGTYTIGVSASSPVLTAYSAGAECSINGSSYSTANCSAITFSDSGLLLTVPTQTSGKTSNSTDGTLVSVAAVKKSDSSLSCTPAFASVTRDVGFWSGYVSPSSGTKTLAVNGTTIGTSSSSPTTLSLSFDSTGTASGVTLNYADAGQISLNAKYTGSTTTSDAGLSMTGSTTFVEVPYGLCVDSTDSGWNCSATATNAQTPANCSVFTKAGSAFDLRVTGKAYSSSTTDVCSMSTTPNYIQSSIPLTSTVFAPTGGSDGSLGTSSISITSSGTATVSTTESEVGDFTLAAVPASAAYFGQTVPSGSAVFGRFIPAGIQISGSLANRSDFTCSATPAFTYIGEPLSATASLTAVNSLGATTANYAGSFARLPLSVSSSMTGTGLAFGAQDGSILLNSRLSSSCTSCGAFSSGVATVKAALTVSRNTGATVDGPYTAAKFGLSVLDSDSVGVYSPDYNWDLDSSSVSEGKLLGSTVLRFGRMRLENAYGSPLLKLNVPAYVQYWNGTSFQKNTDDSCTQLTVPTSSTVTSSTVSTLYCSGGVGLYGSLTGVTASMNGIAAGSTTTLSSGDGGLWLTKPGNTGGGYLDLALYVPDYLRYNWDGVDESGTSCTTTADGYMHDDNPRARIRYGIPRNDKIIYLREVY